MSETWIEEMIMEQRYYNMIEGFTAINEADEVPFDDYEEDMTWMF